MTQSTFPNPSFMDKSDQFKPEIAGQELNLACATGGPAAYEIAEEGMRLTIMLVRKNKSYGNSALTSPCMVEGLSPSTAIRVRMSDKIERILTLLRTPSAQCNNESLDDAFLDLAGYCLLELIALRQERQPQDFPRRGERLDMIPGVTLRELQPRVTHSTAEAQQAQFKLVMSPTTIAVWLEKAEHLPETRAACEEAMREAGINARTMPRRITTFQEGWGAAFDYLIKCLTIGRDLKGKSLSHASGDAISSPADTATVQAVTPPGCENPKCVNCGGQILSGEHHHFHYPVGSSSCEIIANRA